MKRNAIILPITIMLITGMVVAIALYQERSIKKSLESRSEIEKIKFAIQLADVEVILKKINPLAIERVVGRDFSFPLLNGEYLSVWINEANHNVPIDILSDVQLYDFISLIAKKNGIENGDLFAESLVSDIKTLKEVGNYDTKNIKMCVEEISERMQLKSVLNIEEYITTEITSTDIYRLSEKLYELFFTSQEIEKIKKARDTGALLDEAEIDTVKKIEMSKLGIILGDKVKCSVVRISINKKTRYSTRRAIMIYNIERGKVIEKYNN